MTDFESIEAHPGNRDFERINALVCIGWGHTSSAAIVEQPAAEMGISEDRSHIWCNWVAGSLHSNLYEFHGEGKVIDKGSEKSCDVSTLAGGLELALSVLEQMTDINRDSMLNAILEEISS